MRHNTGLFSTIASAGVWDVFAVLYQHGPSWELVPPLLIAVAGLVGAVNSFRESEHRRHMERARQAVEQARLTKAGLTFDQLEGGGRLN